MSERTAPPEGVKSNDAWNEASDTPFPPRMRYQRWDGRGQPVVESRDPMSLSGSLDGVLTRLTHRRQGRIAKLRALPYGEYLRSPEWRSTRRHALARAGHHCQLCGSAQLGLQVHYLTYERVGCEEPDDLAVLCLPCHAAQHAAEAPE